MKVKKKFPTLYRRNNVGVILYWKIKVRRSGDVAKIITEFGQRNTNRPQFSEDVVATGKNLGKSNETSMLKQARLQAKSKWESQKKRGYVEVLKDARKGKLDKIIQGGILPMLAHGFDKQAKKIVYPCFAQPKLDGHRCIAIIKNGKCTLWTRTRKRYDSMPHIVKALEKRFKSESIILDGEFYNHALEPEHWEKAGFNDRFEYIGHIVRPKKPHKDHKKIQYHIFDIVSEDSFLKREWKLDQIRTRTQKSAHLYVVQTKPVATRKDVDRRYKLFMAQGYEGIILRNAEAPYEHKRSYHLQKVKEFQDKEFKCVGIKEGKGKLRGHVGAFVCQTKKGIKFKAKMKGNHSFLKKCFKNKKLWKNKRITVQFQGWTGRNKKPRFPIALHFRKDK